MYFKHWIKKGILGLTLVSVLVLTIGVFAKPSPQSDDEGLPTDGNIMDETYLSSNQFTQEDDLSLVENFLDIPTSYLLVGESSSYRLYMEEGSFAIRVESKIDGFIYGSSISTKDDNLPNFNTTWEGIVNSAVTIKYYSYNDTTGAYTSVEESFLKSEDSTYEYELISNGFEATLYFGESGISLLLRVSLDNDYLKVEIPNESVVEGDTYKLRSIKTYPFLGAVFSNSIPGYILVPDGSGALIRYQEIDVLTDIYEFRYFGQDNSVQTALTQEPVLSFPVSGMILGINQHGFISIVEDGAPNASLVVSPAKNNLKYYYTYNEFLYRSLYQSPLSESQAASSSGRLVIEDGINTCNVVLKYKFLSGADANYVGMASAFQSYLIEEEMIVDHVDDGDAEKLFIEVIGSETKTGFIFDEYLQMTQYSELKSILEEIASWDVNPLVSYKGYSSSGNTSSGLIVDNISKKLGTRQELLELINYAEEQDIDLYFFLDPVKVYDDAKFSIYKDIAKRINQNFMMSSGFTKDIYYISPARSVSAYLDSVAKLKQEEITMYSVGSVGNTLFSDFSDKSNPVDRNEAIDFYQTMFESSSDPVILYQSNLYTLKYSDVYLLLPLSSSRYRIYSDTVPFIPYVLSGLLDKYAPFSNFTSSSRIELLKMVDYGVYPSYIITNQTAYLFQDTELKQIYSSSFSTWKEKMEFDVNFVSSALNAVVDEKPISRERLETGVYVVEYTGGVSIYLNYTNNTVSVDGHELNPLSYEVVNSDG